MYKKPKIIAEIGCNHKGDMGIAFELLDLAKSCGADVAKFQKRNSRELLTKQQYDSPHPNPHNSYGETYGEHREFLEFSLEQNLELMNYCNKIEIDYSTSVWDVTSAKEMVSFNPNFLKVPSACNNHFEMLEVLRDEYKGEVHIISSSGDNVTPATTAKKIAKSFEGCSLEILPGLGHASYVEDADIFSKSVLKFLENN